MTLCQYTLEGYSLSEHIIKPYRWITLEEQKEFVKFLNSFGNISNQIFSTERLSWCASEFSKYRCSHDHNHSKVVRYLACGKRGICPRCSMSYAHKRADIMYRWLRQNLATRLDFDLKLNQIVLTLPYELHDMDKKLFVKMIKAFMKYFGIESYGYCVQDRHSKNPLSDKYIHAHVLSLNFKKSGNRIEKNDYYFDTDKMRDVWKDIINKFTGVCVAGHVNLHTEYASVIHEPAKVKHVLAYLYRYPIQDLFQVQVRDKSINYVQNLQIEKFDGTNNILQLDIKEIYELTSKKSRIVWCGWLTSAKRNELIKLFEIGFEWKNLVNIEKELDLRAKTCRDCGLPLEELPFERGKYEGDNEPISVMSLNDVMGGEFVGRN